MVEPIWKAQDKETGIMLFPMTESRMGEGQWTTAINFSGCTTKCPHIISTIIHPTLYPFVQCVPPPLQQPWHCTFEISLLERTCTVSWLLPVATPTGSTITFIPRPYFARAPLSQWLSTAEVFKLGHSWTLPSLAKVWPEGPFFS